MRLMRNHHVARFAAETPSLPERANMGQDQTGTPPRYESIGTIARRFGYSEETIRALVSRGTVAGVRMTERGPWRVDVQALDEHIRRVSAPRKA